MFEAQPIKLEEVRSTAEEMQAGGWRLITLSAVALPNDQFDIFYHYDRNLEMKHFRLQIPKGTLVPSISPVYFCALLVENECRDLFDITFDGLILDFNRSLYLTERMASKEAPFCKITTYQKPKSRGARS